MRNEFNPATRRQVHVQHAVDLDIREPAPEKRHSRYAVCDGVMTGSPGLQRVPNAQQWAAAVAQARENRHEFGVEYCTLCKFRKAESVCAFWPDDGTDIARAVGQVPQGKMHGVFYGLCRRCLGLPKEERYLRVEMYIMEK